MEAEVDMAGYGFWAALLCRRTFATFLDSDSKMNAEDLCTFVQASIALQENLTVDITKVNPKLENIVVRDLKLMAAINKSWSDSINSTRRTYSPWQFLSRPNQTQVVSVMGSATNQFIVPQVVCYNFIERHLLVDGNPLGSLPQSIRDSETFKELFGNQRPLAFPSSLNSMSHVMATNIHSNEIHFGFRGTRVVIRALDKFCLLGYISRRVFIDGNNFDLLSALTKNCAHWLNILAKRLEIRHQPIIWETRQSDWIVNVSNRRAQRGQDVLVDPHSDLCKRINNIFCYFVNPERLIVYQPAIGTLSVNMPRLGLYFFVNKNNLLECPGVAAEMDPNQDTGTLYGFLSKIVLRNIASHELRRIVTPLEKLIHMCYGMHVAVRVRKTTGYGIFEIDNLLGGLFCPPESHLLYSKAQLHAFTSFVLPDPLTGRAGAEEALHILRSEDCQPLMPMTSNLTSILRAISKLSPSREYYPNDKRRLQTVTWSKRLTANIQNDSYEGLVQEMLAESDRLQFSPVDDNEATDIDIEDLSHL